MEGLLNSKLVVLTLKVFAKNPQKPNREEMLYRACIELWNSPAPGKYTWLYLIAQGLLGMGPRVQTCHLLIPISGIHKTWLGFKIRENPIVNKELLFVLCTVGASM